MSTPEDADVTTFFRILIEVDQSTRSKEPRPTPTLPHPEEPSFEAKMSALLTEEHKRQHSENIKRGLRHKRNKEGKQ